MGIKRVVDIDFWKDDVVCEQYSAEDRYFMLYLLTNPQTKQCGIYHLPIRLIALDMGYSKDTASALIERFENKYKNIIYNRETQEIAILGYLKHSIIKGGKPVEDCLRKELSQVKDTKLIKKVYNYIIAYMQKNIALKNDTDSKSMYVGINKVLVEFIDVNNRIQNDNDNDNERIVPRFVNENIQPTILSLNSYSIFDIVNTCKEVNTVIYNRHINKANADYNLGMLLDELHRQYSLDDIKAILIKVTKTYIMNLKYEYMDLVWCCNNIERIKQTQEYDGENFNQTSKPAESQLNPEKLKKFTIS